MAETSDGSPVPVRWAELVPRVRGYREAVERLLERTLARRADPSSRRILGPYLWTPAEELAELTIALGPETFMHHLERFEPLLRWELEQLTAELARLEVRALTALCYANTARCSGGPVPAEASAVEPAWLAHITAEREDMTREERYRSAYLALAAGVPHLVAELAGDKPLATSIRPGETFGFSQEAWLRYLAAAEVLGAPAPHVEPAFMELVRNFPRMLAASMIRWVDLLAAARAYYVQFEHRPVETVTRALHELVNS